MSKLIPTLLRLVLWSLPAAAACSADALDGTVRVAAVSAPMAAMSKTSTRAVAGAAPRRTLDLRPPDLRSLHVQDVQEVVTSAHSDETEAVAVVAVPLGLEEKSRTHLSLAGIGSLYWAARHPAQAWRVLLPMQPDDGSDASADITARCLYFASTSGGVAACP
jgi:hypothetical protein